MVPGSGFWWGGLVSGSLILLLNLLLPYPATADNYFSKIQKKVESISQLKAESELLPLIVDQNSYKSYLRNLGYKLFPATLREKEELFLKMMGFIEKGDSIGKIRKLLINNGLEGFYNSEKGGLVVSKDKMPPDDVAELQFARAYRKAILNRFQKTESKPETLSLFDDRGFVFNTWFEADSVFLMIKYGDKFTVFPFDVDLMSSIAETDSLMTYTSLGSYSSLYSYPPVVRYQVRAPFIEGIRFINAIYSMKKKGGWNRLNGLAKNPPVSSEQILNPRKYLKKELPVEVKIGYKPEKHRLFHEGVLGEYFINVLLCGEGELTSIVTNWGGDSFRVYRSDKSVFLVWKTQWDDSKSASWFYGLYRNFLERKFGVKFREGNRKEKRFLGASKGGYYYFLYYAGEVLYYVKSNSRNEINKFINGGNYD